MATKRYKTPSFKKNGIVNKKTLFSKTICSCFFIEASWNFICQYVHDLFERKVRFALPSKLLKP